MDTLIKSLLEGQPPMPLSTVTARGHAARLRRYFPHMSYRAISDVLWLYHGVRLNENQVRYACVVRGAPKRDRGPVFSAAMRERNRKRLLAQRPS